MQQWKQTFDDHAYEQYTRKVSKIRKHIKRQVIFKNIRNEIINYTMLQDKKKNKIKYTQLMT